jgi:branched-subunit amino acid transport protein
MTPGVTDGWTLLTIAGLACVTVIARSFFFISKSDWNLPRWAERGLQYAPIAALAAVIIPEMVMSQGALISTFKDARLFALWAAWRCICRCICGWGGSCVAVLDLTIFSEVVVG